MPWWFSRWDRALVAAALTRIELAGREARTPVQVAVGLSSANTGWADLGSLRPEQVEMPGDPVSDLSNGGLARQTDDIGGIG
jgi:hypothetical protein